MPHKYCVFYIIICYLIIGIYTYIIDKLTILCRLEKLTNKCILRCDTRPKISVTAFSIIILGNIPRKTIG